MQASQLPLHLLSSVFVQTGWAHHVLQSLSHKITLFPAGVCWAFSIQCKATSGLIKAVKLWRTYSHEYLDSFPKLIDSATDMVAFTTEMIVSRLWRLQV